MQNKTITILLATYNGEKFLSEQINSILNQSYKNWKLIISDDGSTDNTLTIIHNYVHLYPNQIVYLNNQRINLGPAGNFSELLKSSDETDYFMFSDQDDIWLTDKIETSLYEMNELEKSYPTSPLMVFSDLCLVDENLSIISKSMWKQTKLNPNIVYDVDSLLALNVVTGCTIMINKFAKAIVSPIPRQDIMHDQWIAVMIAKFGHIAYSKKQTILYRQHASNVIGAKSENIYYFLKKTLRLLRNPKMFCKKYTYFPFPINLYKILWKKLFLNTERLLGKS